MKIVNISAFQTVTELPAQSDRRIVSPTAAKSIKTVQSIILKAPKSVDSEFFIKSGSGNSAGQEIINVFVSMNSTKIINVKHQLPEFVGMFAYATGGGVVTVSGVEATLGE